MHPRAQFAPGTHRASDHRLACRLLSLCAILLFCLATLHAQDAPPGTIGRVEGKDVSVEGGVAASGGTGTIAPSIFISSGSVVTVHSGQARLVLAVGGELDICGPAKITLLQSGGAITVALNFGRVHVILPITTSLRIFTPTIVATPLEIRGARRDVTIGLDISDSLCVLATSGALRLEHQFTGEILDVPQSGEFFLAAGKLSPVAGVPGSCLCEELQARATPAPVVPDVMPKAESVPGRASAPPQPEPHAAAAEQAPEPLVTVGVLADANESHPIAAAPSNAAPDPPALSVPEYKIVMPPLTFSANSPEPPPDPTPDMIMLVRVARADPQWQFTGHVEAPHLEEVAQRTAAPSAEAQPAAPAKKKEKKKGGFWAKLKRAFTGG
ncbi:MAG: hypothetical protein ACRD5M_09550 [Candidatus Acidiferrales bacterium]